MPSAQCLVPSAWRKVYSIEYLEFGFWMMENIIEYCLLEGFIRFENPLQKLVLIKSKRKSLVLQVVFGYVLLLCSC